jgi:hypothetical protein
VAFQDLGWLNTPIALTIAVCKATLVVMSSCTCAGRRSGLVYAARASCGSCCVRLHLLRTT